MAKLTIRGYERFGYTAYDEDGMIVEYSDSLVELENYCYDNNYEYDLEI